MKWSVKRESLPGELKANSELSSNSLKIYPKILKYKVVSLHAT